MFYSTIFDYEIREMEMGPIKMGFFAADADQENGGVGGAIVWGDDN